LYFVDSVSVWLRGSHPAQIMDGHVVSPDQDGLAVAQIISRAHILSSPSPTGDCNTPNGVAAAATLVPLLYLYPSTSVADSSVDGATVLVLRSIKGKGSL
jgi:hypothetical protein